MKLFYFGTNLSTPGHYRWIIDEFGLEKMRLNFDDLPFHPESLTNRVKPGDYTFYQGGGYTVIAFAGSPADSRPGSKSVFWVKSTLLVTDMKKLVEENEFSSKIILNIIKVG